MNVFNQAPKQLHDLELLWKLTYLFYVNVDLLHEGASMCTSGDVRESDD